MSEEGKKAAAEIAARLKELTEQRDELLAALNELHALVRGECPSLLDEDSGGCARLDMACEAALTRAERNR